VQVLQPASTPSLKDTKKQIGATVFGGLMGFALIGLVAVGYETRAKKVSSLAELKATGPTTVVGVVPWTPDGAAARDPVKRADVNEAIDKLRAYVAQTWLARGATTVAVTSPLGDEGKAFTAFGLASSLAQAGYKTLLVDFDLRNPSLHPLAGVPNGTGVCELLRGEADPRGAVLALPNGLGFLPAGKWSDEARQAAVGGRLEALLARLREPFDCVVLHGHALLTVAESVEIARRSEVVLLCTLYRETRLPLLRRAAERLTAMEVPYSGVVYLGATPNEALC
jgi:Mrp family chromosome partitioning ATPase